MTDLKKYKRFMTFILLPFVVFGLFYVFKYVKRSDVNAVDLLQVTYNGTSTTDPVFTLDDLKPGDVEEKCFTVKNVNTTDSFDVLMKGILTLEEKEFADVLEIIIRESGGGDVYGGVLGFKSIQNFLDEVGYLNLGNLSPLTEKTFCIKVKFPPEAGNEYQQAKLVFDLTWVADIVENDIPPECRHMTFERVIEGTEGNDVLHASTRHELILLKGGDDYVWASSGNDCIVGGDGNDTIDEVSGNGVILGGNGNDSISSGSGNDSIYGGMGNDTISAGTGDDLIFGGEGDDMIDAGSGNNTAYGGDGSDHMTGGYMIDIFYGGSGNDTLIGNTGSDKLYGEEGNDILQGNSDNDILDGGSDSDSLTGDSGTDTCLNGETVNECEI